MNSFLNQEKSHTGHSLGLAEEQSVSPPADKNEYQPASCMQQTRALVRKNILNKVRTPMGTLLELLSPALFMWIPVLAFSLSEERVRSGGSYTQWEFNLPNSILASNILSVLGEKDFDIDLNVDELIRQTERSWLEKKMSILDFLFYYDDSDFDGPFFNWNNAHQFGRMLQSIEIFTEEEVFDDDFEGYENLTDTVVEFRRELSMLLKSPMPIPSIDQYLTLSQSLSSQFNPKELDLVYQTSDYIRRWGNLLTLGSIHLSPRGKITEEFINYLQDVHSLRNISSSEVLEDRPNATSVLLRVHDDADAAIAYVMDNLQERTFVSINFSEVDDVSSQKIGRDKIVLLLFNLIMFSILCLEFPIHTTNERNDVTQH